MVRPRPSPEARPNETKVRQVIVTGDVTLDWILARSGEHAAHAYWASGRQTKVSRQAGGAALLGSVVKQMARECFPADVRVWCPDESCQSCCSSFSLWEEFPRTNKKDDKQKVWRVAEYLGADPTPSPSPSTGMCPEAPDSAELLILDDAGLGFYENEPAWPKALRSGKPDILLKMSAWQKENGDFRHLAGGQLFQYLIEEHADRLTAVLNINDLRLRDAAVKSDLSWEQTGQDLANEFEHNPMLESLARCSRVVVRLGAAGFFFRERNGQETNSCLFYDPAEIGDSWELRHPGGGIGYTVCTVAAVARYLLEVPRSREWTTVFQRAIGAVRELHLAGYEYVPASPTANLQFPIGAILAKLSMNEPADKGKKWPGVELCYAGLPQPRPGPSSGWTILGARFPDGVEFAGGATAAERIVILGEDEALRTGSFTNPQTDSKLLSVPIARYGGLKTIDRQEIENLRSIGRVVKEYCSQATQTPLSFAVFGPPGCGKSFAIGQMADAIIQGKTTKLTFNLSQFASPAELAEAFHQVRDAALRGEMPLVFWDEFDAKLNREPLGWLKYFLAPMQDGCFQAGPLVHPVGRAIFAFAGSVRSSMREFEEYTEQQEVKDAKGRDFVSRLKGFVNILGPNPPLDAKGDIVVGKDPHYVLRRAIILRGTLERERPLLLDRDGKLRIDSGVLRALLLASNYRHGVRSMASIIAMSTLNGKLKFERSCLPSAAQLNLHVDASEFLAIINGIHFADFESDRIQTMARETHQVFFEYLQKQRFSWAAETDEAHRKHACCIEFDKLTPSDQNENVKFVFAIPRRLLHARFVVAKLGANRMAPKLRRDKVESLARMEHERWMWSKLFAGFQYGPATDRKAGLHERLLTWDSTDEAERHLRYGDWAGAVGAGALPDKHKTKDRLLIRAIPRILKTVGLEIAPIRDPL